MSFVLLIILADDLTLHKSGLDVTVAGTNSILPKEVGSAFYSLHILHHLEKDVCAVASWDSSIHDSAHLNKITERKYLYTNYLIFDLILFII